MMENKKPETVAASPEEKQNELLQTLQRVQADFENYRKRSTQEMNIHYLRGKATAFKEMLAFADTLDAAAKTAPEAHRKDVESLRHQFISLLAQNGIKPIQTMGKTFDPFTSECVMQGTIPQKEEDVVIDEFQKGYFFHDDVLRPAKVKVNKKMESETKTETQKTINGGEETI